jgi:anti-sigma-K factor RskA
MITVLILGTLLGVIEFAVGLRRLRQRLRAIERDGPDSGGSLTPPATMVLGGVAALAVGLALLPFAAAGATPSWVSLAAGGAQILLVAFSAGPAWLLRAR